MLQRATFAILHADVDQSHRYIASHHTLHIQAAHLGKLQQHFGAAIHICAGIDQHKRPFVGGHQRCQSGAGYAFDALDDKGGTHDHSAGAARGDRRVAVARRQLPQPFRHRAFLVLLQNAAWLVIHPDDIRRMYYIHFVKRNTIVGSDLADLCLITGQHNIVAIRLHRLGGTPDHFQRRIIAAKGINDHFHSFSSFPIW